jgi:hypothetical protein
MIENRVLSIDNETQWLPHIGITDLGNLDHMFSGVSSDKIIYDHDWLVFRGHTNIQVDNSKNYTPMNEEASYLDNDSCTQEVLSDLENHGELIWGRSYPPPQVSENYTHIHDYGFIPLNEMNIY